MSSSLIQRYLGNKSPIVDTIVGYAEKLLEPGSLIFDAFSGSLAVSAALRGAGFRVACNDANHFSWLFARAFFSVSRLPGVNGKQFSSTESKRTDWQDVLDELISDYSNSIPKHHRRTDIFDHYCEAGRKSEFTSSRGSSGRRRFFSAENAVLIDRALSRLRYWYLTDKVDQQTRLILTAVLISAVEKVSNTQGTYHDFPREFMDARSAKKINLKLPSETEFRGPISRYIGQAEDTLKFVRQVPRHSMIYIDPPYNFRQYTSYYFMLNLLSKYAEISDIDQYFSEILYVRGQNMKDDFKSTFCSKREFLPSLEKLINQANADYVMLSYFDGRNHWGEFKADKSDTIGKRQLEALFRSSLFVPRSAKCLPVQRLNYQSYGGHEAKSVNEFLFVARKAKTSSKKNLEAGKWTGPESGRVTQY